LVPPFEPLQVQVRVEPQPVRPLSPAAVPVVQAPPIAVLQAPLTGALQDWWVKVPLKTPLVQTRSWLTEAQLAWLLVE
jgi:hypothetical protein